MRLTIYPYSVIWNYLNYCTTSIYHLFSPSTRIYVHCSINLTRIIEKERKEKNVQRTKLKLSQQNANSVKEKERRSGTTIRKKKIVDNITEKKSEHKRCTRLPMIRRFCINSIPTSKYNRWRCSPIAPFIAFYIVSHTYIAVSTQIHKCHASIFFTSTNIIHIAYSIVLIN